MSLHPLRRTAGALLAAVLLAPAGAGAAQSVVGMVDEPCPPPLPMPPAARALLVDLFMRPRTLGPADFQALMAEESFAAYDQELRRRGGSDWAGLCRYRAPNSRARDLIRRSARCASSSVVG